MRYKYTKTHLFLIALEMLFTIGCIFNIIIIYTHGFYGSIFISNLFPFGGLILLSLIYAVILPKYFSDGTYNDKYIRNNYPDIWKLLHGPGFEGDPVKIYHFCKSHYDEGADQKLYQIKFSASVYLILFLWTWFLAVIVMVFIQGARY